MRTEVPSLRETLQAFIGFSSTVLGDISADLHWERGRLARSGRSTSGKLLSVFVARAARLTARCRRGTRGPSS